jgi:hypothetical protein
MTSYFPTEINILVITGRTPDVWPGRAGDFGLRRRRMKLFTAILAIVVVILPVANDALAQETEWLRVPYKFLFTLEAGMGIPSQPGVFKDNWNESMPFTAALGYSILPWVEVSGFFTFSSFGIPENPAKTQIGYIGPEEVTGGTVTTIWYGGIAKAIVLPNSRLMPFFEAGVGVFRASAEDIEVIDGGITNSMESVNGPMFVGGGGLEHNINERWNVYTKFTWTVGLNDDFNPGLLLLGPGDLDTTGSSIHFGALLLGIKYKM